VTAFALNLLLALIWAIVTGMDMTNLAAGFVISYLVLWILRPLLGETRYFQKAPRALRFAGFILMELAIANWRVARDVLSFKPRRRCGIVAVPLDARTDAEITLLANLITLTPGSFSLDVSEDRKFLYVHSMFVEDPEDLRREIKNGFERPVLELLR